MNFLDFINLSHFDTKNAVSAHMLFFKCHFHSLNIKIIWKITDVILYYKTFIFLLKNSNIPKYMNRLKTLKVVIHIAITFGNRI